MIESPGERRALYEAKRKGMKKAIARKECSKALESPQTFRPIKGSEY
jgi:hypothetical protein